MQAMPRKFQFTVVDKQIFEVIVNKYKPIVTCIKTDGKSSRAKNVAWGKIAAEFNTNPHTSQVVTPLQLRRLYMNLKQRQRQVWRQERKERGVDPVQACARIDQDDDAGRPSTSIEIDAANSGIPKVVPPAKNTPPILRVEIDDPSNSVDALSAFSVDSGSEESRSSQNDEEHQEIKKEVPISDEIDEDSELVTQEYAPSLHLTSSQAGQGQNETGDPLLFTTESQPHKQTHRITEKSPQTDARARRPRAGAPSGPTKQNEVLKIHCLKQKMSIMEKEYVAAQERAKELHNMELMVMKERFREAKAKADLAELLLKQQMEKTSMLSKPTPSTVKVRLFANE